MNKSDRDILTAASGVALSAAVGFGFGIAWGCATLALLGGIAVGLSFWKERKRKKTNEKNPFR